MRAAVARGKRLEVADIAEPIPGSGHILVKPLATGICGSDLHALDDLEHFAELSRRVGGLLAMDADQDTVFGHEFCAEVVEYGPDTQRTLPKGTRVCSVPILLGPRGPEPLGYTPRYPGALAEYMVLQEGLALPVPDALDTDAAALTEPLAVGEHAVALADIHPSDVCLVVGCGPVGLAVIAALKARGHGPVLAADFSATRRGLAEAFGADEVIDPADHSPHDRWPAHGVLRSVTDRAAAQMLGAEITNAVIFEAVGVPGMLQSLIDEAPARARIVVVGVCMQTDHIEPFIAVTKELDMRFAFGYSPAEFALTLERLGDGTLAPHGLVTDIVGLEAAADAFVALRSPDGHGKILVRP
jgi:threonine dehydrogenase-like Zn-dependent dehydrogenase